MGVFATSSARADEAAAEADPPKDPQAARLTAAKDTLKWNYVPAGKTERYGHAEALVNAPADVVAKSVTDFARYKDIHRKFATSRVINKEGDSTDVYMRYPVKFGPVKIEFFEVMRFSGIRRAGTSYVLEGTAIRGDMKSGHTVIRVKPVDATHAILECEILLVPRVFIPQSAVDQELRNGAGDYVSGLRDRINAAAPPPDATVSSR